MSPGWYSWQDEEDEPLTTLESAQLRAMEKVVREYEAANRSYADLLYWLATRIVPGEVDQRLTKDPFAFSRMTPGKWQTFFQDTLKSVHLAQGLAPITPDIARLRQKNQELKEQVASLEEKIAELQNERSRLQNAVIAQRHADNVPPEPEPAPATTPVPLHKGLDIPEAPPRKYATLFSGADRPKSRQRELVALALLAATGYSSEASMRWEIVQYCVSHAAKHEKVNDNPESGSIKRLFFRLEEKNLIERLAITNGKSRIIIDLLTDLGRTVVQEMSIPIAEETEWERLMRLHGGERQQKHAAQVCLFAHYARRRGWTTQVCPDVEPPADPDVLIEKDGQRIYVEVEAGSGSPKRRMKKWRNQRELQGFVAICAPTEAIRKTLVQEARANSKKGVATDFMWLRTHKKEPDLGLWAYTW